MVRKRWTSLAVVCGGLGLTLCVPAGQPLSLAWASPSVSSSSHSVLVSTHQVKESERAVVEGYRMVGHRDSDKVRYTETQPGRIAQQRRDWVLRTSRWEAPRQSP